MSKLKKNMLFVLITLLVLFLIPISFAADTDLNSTADVIATSDSSSTNIQSVSDDNNLQSASDEDVLTSSSDYIEVTETDIEIDEGDSITISGTVYCGDIEYFDALNLQYSYTKDGSTITKTTNYDYGFSFTINDLKATDSVCILTISPVEDDYYDDFLMYGDPLDPVQIRITINGDDSGPVEPEIPAYEELTSTGQLYVAEDGDDSNDGSESNPFATISKALDKNKELGGGYEIIVNEGNYVLANYYASNNFILTGRGNVVVSSTSGKYHISLGGTSTKFEFRNIKFVDGGTTTVGSISGSSTMGSNGNAGKVLNIINCTFENNNGYVGVIRTYAVTTILNSTFINNKATSTSSGFGNLIYSGDNTLTVNFCNFINNSPASGKTLIDTANKKVDANFNFWGTNNGPSSSDVSSKVNAKYWAVVNPVVNDETIAAGENYDVYVKYQYTNGNGTVNDLDVIMPTLAVNVSATGSINPANVEITNNAGKVVYTPSAKGTDKIIVKLNDNELGNVVLDVKEGAKFYKTTPNETAIEYTIGEDYTISITSNYSDVDSFTSGSMFVFVNNENSGIVINGVSAGEKSFEFNLADIADKLTIGENNISFHPDLDLLNGIFGGTASFTFDNVIITAKETPYTGVIYVDISNGNDDNNGNETNPVASISKAIELASRDSNTEHKIIIREGTYEESDLEITSDLNIAGEGDVVIDAKELNRILNINAANIEVNITGITFKNGKSSDGAAISIKDAKVNIDKCIFLDNVASNSGGAIYWDADDGTLTNSILSNNTARNAIVSLGVYSWSLRRGSGANTVIENCTFDNNHNVVFGNCIGLSISAGCPNVKVIACNFTNNIGEQGSEKGVLFISGKNTIVDACLFENNTMGMAGAILISDDSEDTQIINSKFINNTVNNGIDTRSGAIEIVSGATIDHNVFIANGGESCTQGGAIDIVFYGDGEVIITNNQFINNTAQKGAAIFSDGGAEDYYEFESLTIEGNTFDGDKAEYGAGIYTVDSSSYTPININNNIFKNLEANKGAGIFVDSTTITLSENTMINCVASEDGNNIYIVDGEIDSEIILTISPSTDLVLGKTLNITVSLTDDNGNSISCAEISVTSNGDDLEVVTTDENGTAVIEFTADTKKQFTISGNTEVASDVVVNNAIINVIDDVKINVGDVSGNAESTVDIPVELIVNNETVKSATVSVNLNNKTFEVEVVDGIAKITLPEEPGKYNLTVSYDGNDVVKTITVTPKPIVSSISIVVIDGLNVTIVLKDINNNVIGNATISYSLDDGNKVNLTTDADGRATMQVKNNCVLYVEFEGNSNFTATKDKFTLKNIAPVKKGTQITVDKTFTRTAVDFPAGEKGYMFYFTLKDETGKVLANKEAKIGVSGKIYTVKTDKNGKAGLMINLANANVYTYAISFLGDDEYKASFAVSKLTVVKKAVTITPAKTSYTFKSAAKSKVITATLKSTNKFIPSGKKVTLTVGGKTYSAVVAKNGKISLNIAKLTKKGTYKVTIKYAGDGTYKAATSKTITVKIA